MTLSNKFGTRIAAFCLFVFALFFAVACSDDEPASLPSEAEGTPCRIAVVLPLDETHKPVWENTVELAVETSSVPNPDWRSACAPKWSGTTRTPKTSRN